MKTTTIYSALVRVYRGLDLVIPSKRSRQHATFERELLRRLDERDQLLAEKNERIARLNAVAAARPGIKPWSNDR